MPRWYPGAQVGHRCLGVTLVPWLDTFCLVTPCMSSMAVNFLVSTNTNQNVLMIEAALRPGGLLRVHCPTMAGFGYRTIKVATDSTVVEVQVNTKINLIVNPTRVN